MMRTVESPHAVRLVARAFVASVCVTLCVAAPATASDVLAGADLFRTDPATTYQDFSVTPIPADFFDPGSDPFTGVVQFAGESLGSSAVCPHDDLSLVDTIVQRQADAILPCCPGMDTVPIELVELSLVSVSPIVVTYNGGFNPELWNLRVTPPRVFVPSDR